MLHSYKELTVWQRSIELVVAVYQLTDNYPKEELYGLTSQTRRAAVSIPANIAEGRFRGSRKDFTHYITIAYASGAELETLIEIAKRLPNTKHLDYSEIDTLLLEVMKMLNKMLSKLHINHSKANKLESR